MPEQPTEATPADVLRDAATLLREKGWCRGDYQVGEALCVLGAVGTSLGMTIGDCSEKAFEALAFDACGAMQTFLGLRPPPGIPLAPLIAWNDIVATDGEQVAQVMEKAAAAWEEVAGL